MNIQEVIQTIHYWDSTLLRLEVNHFADELILSCEEGTFQFTGCNQLKIENYHVSHDEGLSPKDWEMGMSPYLIQDISAVEIEKEKRRKYQGKYEVKITMDLMVIHFSCHTIHVS